MSTCMQLERQRPLRFGGWEGGVSRQVPDTAITALTGPASLAEPGLLSMERVLARGGSGVFVFSCLWVAVREGGGAAGSDGKTEGWGKEESGVGRG